MAVCGAGCMGFWNVRTGLRAMGYVEREDLPVGPISVVTHSGSVFSTLLRTRRRLGFDLVVSSGQELVTTTADYVDHIVDAPTPGCWPWWWRPSARGDRLRASLRRAREAGLEVVVLPVGGSPLGLRWSPRTPGRSPATTRPGRRSPRTPAATGCTTWPS